MFLLNIQALAQKSYKSKAGLLIAKAENDYVITSHSFKRVTVSLDYDKAEVEIRFMPEASVEDSTFFRDEPIELKASLSIPSIKTQPHPDQRFFTRGKLHYKNKTYTLHGTGELKHHPGGETYTCTLMLQLKLSKSESLLLPGIGQVIEFLLHQTVLDRDF
ncbi:hypothetical protein BFP97_16675 [Roseivirga sp. 4D4]|nr:hypothetical protein BFP97_16675 [Roseivirga sp. 4D4]